MGIKLLFYIRSGEYLDHDRSLDTNLYLHCFFSSVLDHLQKIRHLHIFIKHLLCQHVIVTIEHYFLRQKPVSSKYLESRKE